MGQGSTPLVGWRPTPLISGVWADRDGGNACHDNMQIFGLCFSEMVMFHSLHLVAMLISKGSKSVALTSL